MTQPGLFPIRIRYELPANFGTADLKLVGRGDDGYEYALKTIEDGPLLPATEWVCHQLCRAVGIATPDFAAVHRPDGTVAFGSRIEACEQVDPTRGDPVVVQIAKLFSADIVAHSRIFGVDAVVGNHDRHLGNFLFRPTSTGLLPLAFDFSRAWVHNHPPFGLAPWVAGCKSDQAVRWLRNARQFDPASAEDGLDAMYLLPATALSQALASCHASWTQGYDWSPTLHVWEQQRASLVASARQSLS